MDAEQYSQKSEKKRKSLLPFLPLVFFIALAVLFIARLMDENPSRIPSALIGRDIPTFSLPPLTGLVREGAFVPGLSSKDLMQGKVTVVNVWASWCVPCRQEHPLLMELAKDPRIVVVGVNYKDKSENARRFLSALGNPYAAVGVDERGFIGIDLGVYGVPETFIVGSDGTIRYKHVGPLEAEIIHAEVEKNILEASQK